MRPINDSRRYESSLYLNQGNENTGQDSFRRAEEEARIGSEALKEAIDKLTWKFAWRHGIEQHEARHLLLNTGVRLPFPLEDAA